MDFKKLEFPSILHNVFESPDGKGIGFVFFNWTENEIKFDAPISTDMDKGKKYDVYKYGKDGDVNKPIMKDISFANTNNLIPPIVSLTLGSGEAVFIELVPK
jgi:hypothetical protein